MKLVSCQIHLCLSLSLSLQVFDALKLIPSEIVLVPNTTFQVCATYNNNVQLVITTYTCNVFVLLCISLLVFARVCVYMYMYVKGRITA